MSARAPQVASGTRPAVPRAADGTPMHPGHATLRSEPESGRSFGGPHSELHERAWSPASSSTPSARFGGSTRRTRRERAATASQPRGSKHAARTPCGRDSSRRSRRRLTRLGALSRCLAPAEHLECDSPASYRRWRHVSPPVSCGDLEPVESAVAGLDDGQSLSERRGRRIRGACTRSPASRVSTVALRRHTAAHVDFHPTAA